MWQTDQAVFAMAYASGVVFAGGTFTEVRPPGALPGQNTSTQARLAAFDAQTGEFIASWRPQVSGGKIFAMDVSPDGKRLYVGGTFNTINGIYRSNVAAFDLTNPNAPRLLPASEFKAGVDGKVTSVAATDNALYVGGYFNKAVGGYLAGTNPNRTKVASFDSSDGRLTPFSTSLSGSATTWYPAPFVTALEATNERLYIGGMFNLANGESSSRLAVVDPVTGASDADFDVPAIEPTSYVVAIAQDAGRLFISGRDDHTGRRSRLEGVMSLDDSTGEVLWGSDGHRCMADTFALEIVHGKVWAGTHAHDCSDIGGHPEASPRTYLPVQAQDVISGEQAQFYPLTGGNSSQPGSRYEPRAMATDGEQLFVGGGWLQLNGDVQQNLARFSPTGPNEPPTRPFATVTAGPGEATISWLSAYDRDNMRLTYEVFRKWSSVPFATFEADSSFWDRPRLEVVDTEVTPGESVFYRVSSSDGNTSFLSVKSNTVTVDDAPSSYEEAVVADGAASYWPLDDAPESPTAIDASGNANPATVNGSVTFGAPGARSTAGNTALQFTGQGHLSSQNQIANPQTYSMEAWFRTSTTSGGKIIGFGNGQSGNSSRYDRHLYMSDDGRLHFGTYSGGTSVASSATAFNDGSWHHVVTTQGASGMKLFVDGDEIASNPSTAAEAYDGYIRVGDDNMNGWPDSPSDTAFSGFVDDVAFYNKALTSGAINRHYSLR